MTENGGITGQPVPETDPLHPLDTLPQDVVRRLDALTASLRPVQMRYLAAAIRFDRSADAATSVGIAPDTVMSWRYREPGFKEAERLLMSAAAPEARRQFTAAILTAAAPSVALDIVKTALMSPTTDREMTAKQRAAETVLQHALPKQQLVPEGVTETIEAIAIRIKRQTREIVAQEQAKSPPVPLPAPAQEG